MSHPPPNPLPDKPPIGLYGGCVLFAAPSAWDEVCFSTPALRAIRAARPHCSLGVICEEKQADYWTTVPGLNEILVYDRKTRLRDLLEMQKDSFHRWDAAILWEKNLAAEFARAHSIKQRIGFGEKSIAKFLTDAVTPDQTPGPVRHRVQYYLELMESLKIPTKIPEIFSPCPLDVSRIEKLVVISPQSDFGPSHEWNLISWKETIEMLQQVLQAKVTLLKISHEKNSLIVRLKEIFPSIELVEIDEFSQSLPLLAAASLTIAADSSLCHLSAHVGTPTISLFGPNDPEWRRPLGKIHSVVRQKVECSPCLLSKCPLDRRCQHELTSGMLKNVIQEHWQKLGYS